jgi:RNA polymerase sigma-70 factor (ECF subfamily)
VAGDRDPRDDDLLLAASRGGDAAALEALIVRHQPRVYRFGLKMCRNAEDAADVVQETFAAMARTVRGFRGDASVPTWLYTIARSFCLKKRRRRRFAPARTESLEAARAERLPDQAPDPERTAAREEVASALSHAIDSLEPAQREVLVLRDVEGLSASEVAGVLRLTVPAVKSRLHRARLTVRARMAPLLERPAAGAAGRCPNVLMLFSQHLEGEIAPEACARMQAHLAACRDCRGACESLKRTLALCGATPAPQVPASLRDSVRDAIRDFLQQTA